LEFIISTCTLLKKHGAVSIHSHLMESLIIFL
jgi:hypothetical protein